MALSFVLYVILVRKYINPFSKELLIEVGKTLISTIPVALVCYFSLPYFQNASAVSLASFVLLTLKIVAVGLASLLPFFVLSKLLKVESYKFVRLYLRGLTRSKHKSNS